MKQLSERGQRRGNWQNILLAYSLALAVTYGLASMAQSFFTLKALQVAGAELQGKDWLRTIGHDLYGLAFRPHLVSFALLVAISLAIGFAVAGLIRRRWTIAPRWLFPLAGASAMGLFMLLAHGLLFGEHFFSATRTLPAQLSQALAGALGGVAYAWVRANPQSPSQ